MMDTQDKFPKDRSVSANMNSVDTKSQEHIPLDKLQFVESEHDDSLKHTDGNTKTATDEIEVENKKLLMQKLINHNLLQQKSKTHVSKGIQHYVHSRNEQFIQNLANADFLNKKDEVKTTIDKVTSLVALSNSEK